MKFPQRAEVRRPSSVRIRIVSRSNSANAPNTWKMSLPTEVLKSMSSFNEAKETWCLRSVSKIAIRSESDREMRSIRHTSTKSNWPALAASSSRFSPGRSALAPVACSEKIQRSSVDHPR